MKRHIQNLILAVVIFSLPALGSRALAEDVNGTWKMEMVPHAGVSQIFIVKIDGSIAQFYDVNKTKIAEGTISKNAISAKSVGEDKPYTYQMSVDGTTMSGATLTPNGDKIKWQATKIVGVYKCENHSPAHISATLEEMEAQTKQHQCKGWSKVR